MPTQDAHQKAADAAEREPDETSAPHPRGNPDTDRESVQKGKEQLDKVSGN